MNQNIKTEKAKKINLLVDVEVVADLSGMLWYTHWKNEEEKAKELERAVKEFIVFLRDHRSQDLISLDVRRIHEDVCSVCKERWEEDEDDNGKFCASCGAKIDDDNKRAT